jgi:hypothetical protein
VEVAAPSTGGAGSLESSRLRVSRDNDPVDAARARPVITTTDTAAASKIRMMTIATSTE